MNTQPLSNAFSHAFNGIYVFFKNDRNGKLHIAIALLVILAGWYLHISSFEWMILLLCIALVISLEMANHALEKLCDAVHPEQHPLIKTTKDVAAAAVLWSVIMAVLIGMIIFLPKISQLL